MPADVAQILTFCSDPNIDQYRSAQLYVSSNMATFGAYDLLVHRKMISWKRPFTIYKTTRNDLQLLPVGYFPHLLYSK
jgi:hypothetical protein